ncbi:MAG TPA: hypothetical protein VFR67_10285, partial [Pilimelia sp.]|nr:hypothetical protein [Pilimelia sp.]
MGRRLGGGQPDTRRPGCRRWLAGLVGVLAGLLGGLAAPAGPASAHAALVSTNPTQGSVVGGPRTE